MVNTVLDLHTTNYPECLKYYHGKAYVIISKTMIFQNSDYVVVCEGRKDPCLIHLTSLFTLESDGRTLLVNGRVSYRLRVTESDDSSIHYTLFERIQRLGKTMKKKKQRLEERNVRNYNSSKRFCCTRMQKINEEEKNENDPMTFFDEFQRAREKGLKDGKFEIDRRRRSE